MRMRTSRCRVSTRSEKGLHLCLNSLTDSFTLSFLRVRPKLACLREAAPLLELDRDERKLEAFLQLHKSDLLVADLRIFLPFTINLDPYLRKVLKGKQGNFFEFVCSLFILPFFVCTEDQQVIEDEGSLVLQTRPSVSHSMRAQPAPTTYVPSPQIYPPYQMLQNEFVANELRVRNVGALEPTAPLLPSPSDSFGVSSDRYFIYCIYTLLYVLYILYIHYFIPYSISFHS